MGFTGQTSLILRGITGVERSTANILEPDTTEDLQGSGGVHISTFIWRTCVASFSPVPWLIDGFLSLSNNSIEPLRRDKKKWPNYWVSMVFFSFFFLPCRVMERKRYCANYILRQKPFYLGTSLKQHFIMRIRV